MQSPPCYAYAIHALVCFSDIIVADIDLLLYTLIDIVVEFTTPLTEPNDRNKHVN